MRDLAKTATYSLVHFSVSLSVAYALTGSWQVAATIGLVEPLVQTVAYALHEQAWKRPAKGAKAAWGKVVRAIRPRDGSFTVTA